MRASVINGYKLENYKDFKVRETGLAVPEAESLYMPQASNGYRPDDFIVDSSLVFYAPLGMLKGGTFNSVDAYGHLCTVTGALWRPNGHYFDGSGDIDITPVLTNALAATTTGTIGFWVKVPDATPAGAMASIAFGDTDGNEYLRLLIQTGGQFQCNSATAGDTCWSLNTNNAVFSDNAWAYAELIHDGESASVRINGVAVDQTLTDEGVLTAWFNHHTALDNGFIGKSSFNDNANRNPLTGTIGEVIIHNRVLPTAEGLHNYLTTRWRYT